MTGIPEEGFRECSKCGRTLRISEENFLFYNHNKIKPRPECRECGRKRSKDRYYRSRDSIVRTGRRKMILEDVIDLYESEGAIFLSDTFVNQKSSYKYICNCGNIHRKSVAAFKKNPNCPECYRKNMLTLSEVKAECSFKGMEFLDSEYFGVDHKHKVKCVCGKVSERTLDSIKKGRLCWECGVAKNTGENSSRWIEDLTYEDRHNARRYPGYYAWRKEVFDRCGGKCVSCFTTEGEMHAHHIIPHSINKDLRIEVYNGTVMCRDCHKEYHSEYSLNNVNKETLEVFSNNKIGERGVGV